MSNANQNEQWKLHGDCSICRRKNYCSKPCARCKRSAIRKQNMIIREYMNKITGGVMNELINKGVDRYM